MAVWPYLTHAGQAGAGALPVDRSVMGVLGFGTGRPAGLPAAAPFAAVTMRVLDGGPCCEVWASDQSATWHEAGAISYALAGEALFGVIDPGPQHGRTMEEVAYDIYAGLFALADRTGRRHVIRAFNYLAAITGDEGGTERYRRFNTGRQAAFAAAGRMVEAAPAACALGMRSGGPIVAFLASTQAGQPVENPRQVSAYRYPASHGPTSPSFSRAMLTGPDGARVLHVSGTASIVGHRSVHLGDAAAQTEEILRNYAALLAQCGGLELCDVAPALRLRAYVRHARDADAVRGVLSQHGITADVMFVQAEICRKELLVELEGFVEVK